MPRQARARRIHAFADGPLQHQQLELGITNIGAPENGTIVYEKRNLEIAIVSNQGTKVPIASSFELSRTKMSPT